jgi:hypothetical protein
MPNDNNEHILQRLIIWIFSAEKHQKLTSQHRQQKKLNRLTTTTKPRYCKIMHEFFEKS